MAQKIKIKRSSTSGNKLTASNSEAGEFGLNTADKALYIQTGTTNADVVTVYDDNLMHLDDTNNRVGIKTTSPAHTLDVAGNIAISGTEIVDSSGNWTGPNSGIKGEVGPTGAKGDQGDQGSAGRQQVQQVQQVHKVTKALQVLTALQGLQALKATQGYKVHKEIRAILELMVHKVHRATKVNKVHKVHKGIKVLQGAAGPQGSKGDTGALVHWF